MAANTNLSLTVEAWADIVIKNWKQKITDLGIGFSGNLYDSFQVDVISNANTPERVEFAHLFYGNFVDMGVGKGQFIFEVGDGGSSRKSKAWKSKIFWAQTAKLSELLADKYAIKAATHIVDSIRIVQSS